ncbi:MAG: lysophospholipid acyltransferase family protein [Armatimonadota bacterium]|jgi:KDO2-lipid IV(A) lauroyltransferase
MSSSDASSRLHDKGPLRRKTEQLVIRWVTGFFALLARLLPLRWLQAIGNAAGSVLFRLLRPRREIAMGNLERIFGDRYDDRERLRIINFSVRSMAKTMLELLKVPWMSEEQLRWFAPVRGEEHLRQAAEAGNGVIVITGHFGNWEVLAATIARLGYDLSVIARDANDPGTANIINRSREMAGEHVLPREGVREMLRVLREGDVLGILPDQHANRGGIWLPFMGRLACTATGPATLANRTGATVVPGFARRTEDDQLDVYFLPPLDLPDTGDREADIRRGTEMVNEVLGEQIARYPEQWVWMHRRWREPPEEVVAAGQAE